MLFTFEANAKLSRIYVISLAIDPERLLTSISEAYIPSKSVIRCANDEDIQ
jgi:hypothetical protein